MSRTERWWAHFPHGLRLEARTLDILKSWWSYSRFKTQIGVFQGHPICPKVVKGSHEKP